MFSVPAGIGRLPSSISSCYGAFTASQWKNWITIYSPLLLKGLLPQEHLRCWLLFVRACSLLCSNCIQKNAILSADTFFIQFCRECEYLYGSTGCTFNMHLHLHLKQIFLLPTLHGVLHLNAIMAFLVLTILTNEKLNHRS